MAEEALAGKHILLGVTGSIAAYKAADIASRLVASGADVQVVMTHNATQFITPITMRALTGHTPLIGLFDELNEGDIAHIAAVEKADVLLVAPATANIIAKAANALADDMLSTLITAAQCPLVFAPAMNTHMWNNPLVGANVDRLRSMGHTFVEPAEGRLACGTVGIGKLASINDIIGAVENLFDGGGNHDLSGTTILITAGPTREPIDPVRYVSNYSTGRMGYAIAEMAASRGAHVILVTGPAEVEPPSVAETIRVQTAEEMLLAVRARYNDAEVVIGAAAVSDFRPYKEDRKIKKISGKPRTLELLENTDIMAELGGRKDDHVLISFALETEDLVENALKKLAAKNVDMVVANIVDDQNQPFGEGPSRVRFITSDGEDIQWPLMSKPEIAGELLNFIKNKYLAAT